VSSTVGSNQRKRVGVVVPRYGEHILGGAETLARWLVEHLAAAGHVDVQVLTTCANDYVLWKNEMPAGATNANGVMVRRFRVDDTRQTSRRFHELNRRIGEGQFLESAEQYEWVHLSAHSSALYRALALEAASFDFLVFIPYLFPTTYYGTAISPERSILWPCLHDEVYAYLQPSRDMFRLCRGVVFNSEPEQCFAESIYGSHPGAHVVGIGVTSLPGDGARFRQQFGLPGPFLMYSGRLEGAKNLPQLMEYFIQYKRQRGGPLKLALMGSGPVVVPHHPDIIKLGFLPEQAKRDAFAAATLVCQPSLNESFSIVIMEAWLAGAPVVVHAGCEVTRYHAVRSNGGLYYRGYAEFASVLDLLLGQPAMQRRLGLNGQAYVREHYAWPVVLKRFEEALAAWSASAAYAPQ
jgi:glycosyltransferase involved in cell wall biosynthesis